MPGRWVPLLIFGLAGCARHVVKIDSDPAGAAITLGGSATRDARWSVPADSVAEIAATWPDGQRLTTALTVDRDMHVLLRKHGDPAGVVGARLAGPPVAAAPAPTPPTPRAPAQPAEPPADDPLARARALAVAGQNAFDLTDYDDAILKFKQAYELVQGSKDPKAPEILGNILYNLAVVYERSHDLKPEPERLRRARIMYRQFDEQMATLVPNWSGTAEHADVLRRIRALDVRLEATP